MATERSTRAVVEYLNPRRKLVDEFVDWLCGRMVLDEAGARSLAHLLVVVPTAQSGRSLRLRLAQVVAERFDGAGVLPPRIVQPMQLIAPADESYQTATDLHLRAAFLKFLVVRPHRRQEAGRTVLEEWQSLFRPEYIADVRSHLSFFDQLSDIWRILAANGLMMSDVVKSPRACEVLEAAAGDELPRWTELGEFETAYFDFLHTLGLRHEVEAIHLAKTSVRPISDEIREVVLPSLADPLPVLYDVLNQQRDSLRVTVLLHAAASDATRFDSWGRPLVAAWTGATAPMLDGIREEDVIRSGTDTELAHRLAEDFPPVDADLALPTLGLCDESLFPELAAAFLNGGRELHNPDRHPLLVSSLGQLVSLLADLYAADSTGVPWETFAALLRLDDVMSTVVRVCPKNEKGEKPTRVDILTGLNICRNTFLPLVVTDDVTFDIQRIKYFDRRTFEAFQTAARMFLAEIARVRRESDGLSGFVRSMLEWVFASRTILGDVKEFGAAADLVRELLAQLDDAIVTNLALSESAVRGLFRKALSDAAYSLEPDSPHALKTEGWLELAWSAADKIALAGFHEGMVPDAVVGHAFLPDTLREALGLMTNERRLARDTFLLWDILTARATEQGSVRAYISQTNNQGDIHRPSRLLFLVPLDRLAARAKALFGDLPPQEPLPPRQIADAWRPRLPMEGIWCRTDEKYPNGRLSASAINTWLECPFTYFLENAVEMRRVVEKTELEANDFGTLIHQAMELYADEQLERTAKGLAQLHELADIEQSFHRIMQSLRRSYDANESVNLRLQLDAAEGRLKSFARIQARWAQEGWRVAEKPEYAFTVRPFEGEKGCDVTIKGSVDRIDFKDGVGYRIIDYKTWESRQGAMGHILKSGVEHANHAERLRLPILNADQEPKKRSRCLSVQLPLYGRCLVKADPAKFGGKIADYCYLLLAATESDTTVLGSLDDQGPFEAVLRGKVPLANHVEFALETARTAIRRIKAGIFWPPGPSEKWKYQLKDLFLMSPERDFPPKTAWREAQERKLAALANGEEVEA